MSSTMLTNKCISTFGGNSSLFNRAVYARGGGGGRNSLCYTTEKGDIAVPGNRVCAVAIEWLLRAQ